MVESCNKDANFVHQYFSTLGRAEEKIPPLFMLDYRIEAMKVVREFASPEAAAMAAQDAKHAEDVKIAKAVEAALAAHDVAIKNDDEDNDSDSDGMYIYNIHYNI